MILQLLLSWFRLLQSLRHGQKGHHFPSVPIADSSLVFVEQIDLNRLEKLFRMIKSLEPTYKKDLAWSFSFSYLDFDFYRASDMGKRASFLTVSIADTSLVFVEQIDLNRLEKLSRMIKSLIPTHKKDLTSSFSFSYLDFDFYRTSDMGKRASFP